jgi:ubiquitin carboxyl-terminal hydrolase 2/21
MTAERERLRLQFFSLPDVLVVNLKRYYQIGDQEMQITDPVEGIERTLKLNSQAVLTGESADYRCVAFLVHTGSFQSGHYIAYIWKEGRWWCCNDALIYAVSDQEARQQMRNCYLFFATRK